MKEGDTVLVRMTVVRRAADTRTGMSQGWVMRSARTSECYVEGYEIDRVVEEVSVES